MTCSELALLRVLANPQVADDEPVPPLDREPVRSVAAETGQRRQIQLLAHLRMDTPITSLLPPPDTG